MDKDDALRSEDAANLRLVRGKSLPANDFNPQFHSRYGQEGQESPRESADKRCPVMNRAPVILPDLPSETLPQSLPEKHQEGNTGAAGDLIFHIGKITYTCIPTKFIPEILAFAHGGSHSGFYRSHDIVLLRGKPMR